MTDDFDELLKRSSLGKIVSDKEHRKKKRQEKKAKVVPLDKVPTFDDFEKGAGQ